MNNYSYLCKGCDNFFHCFEKEEKAKIEEEIDENKLSFKQKSCPNFKPEI